MEMKNFHQYDFRNGRQALHNFVCLKKHGYALNVRLAAGAEWIPRH